MSLDNIEKLYKYYGVLADAKEKISEHEVEYLAILEAVKGSDKEKRLASQFIARFFKHFPKLANDAIMAQMDLCEDNDVAIRKQAIKDLPSFCKDNLEHVKKIADIVAQLLQSDDVTEIAVVHNSLMTLIKLDPKAALGGIFSQILTAEELIRERCLKFLALKIKQFGSDIMTTDVEDSIISQCKKTLEDVTCDEFHTLMSILSHTRLGKSVAGHQQLVDIVSEQSELDGPFDMNNTEDNHAERLSQCLTIAMPYFSSQVDSARFVAFICDKVLPVFSDLVNLDTPDASDSVTTQLNILKQLAELCSHCKNLERPAERASTVYKLLLEYMPLPPEGDTSTEPPSLQFSHVECLLYSYHALMRLSIKQTVALKTGDAAVPGAGEMAGDMLKDFRLRLQYFARGVQAYIKILKEALKGKTDSDLKSDENQLKVVALRTTSNINTLIKDLFHTPPSYKTIVTLSWITPGKRHLQMVPKQTNEELSNTNSLKRHTPITFESSTPKQPRRNSTNGGNKRNGTDKHGNNGQKMYTPPSGKYSAKVSGYVPTTNRGGYRGRGGRGGFNRNYQRGGSFRGRNQYRSNTY